MDPGSTRFIMYALGNLPWDEARRTILAKQIVCQTLMMFMKYVMEIYS